MLQWPWESEEKEKEEAGEEEQQTIMKNYVEGLMQEASCRGAIIKETSEGYLGNIWEASGSHLEEGG